MAGDQEGLGGPRNIFLVLLIKKAGKKWRAKRAMLLVRQLRNMLRYFGSAMEMTKPQLIIDL